MRRFVPPVPSRSSCVRLLTGIAFAVGLAITSIEAQIPGRNINMVAGNTWPDGDPFLQRQNEPSIAASTRNPLHLLAGSNDYRTVDMRVVAATHVDLESAVKEGGRPGVSRSIALSTMTRIESCSNGVSR